MRFPAVFPLLPASLPLLLATWAPGQCNVVADINASGAPRSSGIEGRAQLPILSDQYRPLLGVGGEWFFTAENTLVGRELWKTDGTTAGTVLVTDLRPGRDSSDPRGLWRADFPAGPRLVFGAQDPSGTHQLHVSDGTQAGTIPLSPLPTTRNEWARVGNQLVFANGEPWITDGTVGGTRLLRELEPGAAEPNITLMTEEPTTGQTFFVATTQALGSELWVTDGTAAGTRVVRDITPGSAGTTIFRLVAHRGLMFFTVVGGLWCSDGTSAGTIPLLTQGGITLYENAAIGSRMFFAARTTTLGTELYETDGTVAGTRLTADLRAGSSSSFPRALHANGNTLFMQVNLASGNQPAAWSNGVLTPIRPPGVNFDALAFRGAGPLTWISVFDSGANGSELWSTDGTVAGTRQVREIFPGPGSSRPGRFTPIAGTQTLFVATDPIRGQELWLTDGSTAGTSLLADVDPIVDTGNSIFTNQPTILHGELACLEAESQPGTGLEPHLLRLGDTAAIPLGDLNPGPGGSAPSEFVSLFDGVRETILFRAIDGTHGGELWASDGTAAGTRLVIDLRPGPVGSSPMQLTVLGNECYFIAAPSLRRELWKTDGTAVGTVKVSGLEVQSVTTFRGQVLFSGYDGAQARLWVTDGTAAGTNPLASTNLDTLFGLVADGDRRVFGIGRSSNTGFETFVFDLQGNASLAADLFVGRGSGTQAIAGVFGGRALMIGTDGSSQALWSTDGSPSSVQRLGDAEVLSIGSETAFFSGAAGTFVTDGTAAGTTRVAEQSPAILTVGPGCYCSEQVGFDTLVRYVEPGRPTRTECMFPRGASSLDPEPSWYRVVGNQLWFGAIHPSLGREPHRLTSAPGAYVSALGGACGGTFASLNADRPVLGSAMTLRGERTRSAGGVLLFGRTTPGPVALPGISTCGTRLDTSALITVTTISRPSWSSTITVPNQASLAATELSGQAVFLSAPGSGNLIDTSDALRLLIGR